MDFYICLFWASLSGVSLGILSLVIEHPFDVIKKSFMLQKIFII